MRCLEHWLDILTETSCGCFICLPQTFLSFHDTFTQLFCSLFQLEWEKSALIPLAWKSRRASPRRTTASVGRIIPVGYHWQMPARGVGKRSVYFISLTMRGQRWLRVISFPGDLPWQNALKQEWLKTKQTKQKAQNVGHLMLIYS